MPSARNQVAFGEAPTSLNSVASGTPVHSLVLVRPASWPGVRLRTGGARQVAGALEEVDARHRREALQVVEGEHHRPLDHAVNQQRVAARIDVGDAAVMPLEVEVGGRDDAHQVLVRSARRGGASSHALQLRRGGPLADAAWPHVHGPAWDRWTATRTCASAVEPRATALAAVMSSSRRETFMECPRTSRAGVAKYSVRSPVAEPSFALRFRV